MRCPICEALNREHGLLCQLEATVILRNRNEASLDRSSFDPSGSASANQPSAGATLRVLEDNSEAFVLATRKRQAQILNLLENHKAKAHSA
jgi:hypothetical protein